MEKNKAYKVYFENSNRAAGVKYVEMINVVADSFHAAVMKAENYADERGVSVNSLIGQEGDLLI